MCWEFEKRLRPRMDAVGKVRTKSAQRDAHHVQQWPRIAERTRGDFDLYRAWLRWKCSVVAGSRGYA
jgi:hypothetical protein